MNPRDFDPDITRIVDELRGAGGIITGLFIRRADGTCIGKPPEADPGPHVSGLCDVAVALTKAGPGRKTR
jgi:hypothetical protein